MTFESEVAELNRAAERAVIYKFFKQTQGEESVDMVEAIKKGTTNSSTVYRVGKLENERPHIWADIHEAYGRWKEGHEEPEDGTPLVLLKVLDEPTRNKLKNFNVRCIEDLAEINDASCDEIGMGAQAWRNHAREFIKAQNDVSAVAKAAAESQKEIDELKIQLARLTEDLDASKERENAAAAKIKGKAA